MGVKKLPIGLFIISIGLSQVNPFDIDGAGKNKYNERFAKNKKVWKQTPPLKPALKTEWGVGIDY